MKNLCVLCVALIVVVGLASTLSAGEISKSTLASMGLGSMSSMSDADGLAIRGKGTVAVAWGSGTARAGSSSSTNGYFAASSHRHGTAFAAGANISAAASINHGFKAGIAGGASFAIAR